MRRATAVSSSSTTSAWSARPTAPAASASIRLTSCGRSTPLHASRANTPPERIPSFDEYCEWASGETVGHNIEIKTDKIYYHDIERKIWATIERYGLEHKVMFSSFNHFSLRRILEISGNAVEVGALVLEDSIGGFPGYYCEQAGFACYHPPIELLTDENVRDCKEHGVKMNVWTVNDMAGLEQLHRWGCEGIITNYPGVASGWLRAQGE